MPLAPTPPRLGLAYYGGSELPAPFQGGMFIGQHGSWNRSEYSGYKVIFVPFKDGRPSGNPIDVLTGFLKQDGSGVAHGRPVGVAMTTRAPCSSLTTPAILCGG